MDAVERSGGRLGAVQAAVEELDLGALGSALWRRKKLILALTLGAAAIAFAAVNVMTPRYLSEARVLIESRDNNIFLRPEADKTLDAGITAADQEAVASQVQLILSRDLARDIISRLKLGERSEFDPALSGAARLRTLFALVGIGRDPMSMTAEERTLRTFQERLSAFQVEKSRVIAIEFESEDPDLAAMVANSVAERYLVLQQAAKQMQTRAASQWLAGEIDKLQAKVADAEAKVEQYRSKAGLFMGANNTPISTQQLTDFNAQISAGRALKADAEAKAQTIRAVLHSGAPIEFSDIINSDLMRRLSEQRVTLRAQLAQQSSTLLESHPHIKELKAQISDLETQMRAEAERMARGFENDAKLADARMTSLNAGLDQLKQQASSSNQQDVQLRALERDAKSQRDLLESYLAKYREATARDSIDAASPDARVVSTATVQNTPAWPKKLPTVLVAMLGMLALSTGFVLTGELLAAPRMPVARSSEPILPPARRGLDRRIAQAATAGAHEDEAPIEEPDRAANDAAAVPEPEPQMEPQSPRRAAAVQTGVPLDAVEELAREVMSAGAHWRRIMVVGAERNIGTTMATITLARSLAERGRVILIDLAFASPNLSVIASERSGPGITDLVHGTASHGEIISSDRHSRLHVVTVGGGITNAATVLTSQRLTIAVEALARSYDYLVIDGGVLPAFAAQGLAKVAPNVVLVATAARDLATIEARERLLGAGFANATVLVSVPIPSQAAA